MDVLSHGLWGGLAFGRKNRKNFWLAFFFGVAPDIFSFGIFFLLTIFGLVRRPDFSFGPPDPALIPLYIHKLYNLTHSLVIFILVFVALWIIFKKPFWPVSAWGLHILMDIFTHPLEFFPTPFLWPISDFKVNALSWGSPWIFIPNLILLVILYIWFFIVRRRKVKKFIK